MKILNLEQRSDDWLTWRAGGIGGSDAAAILGLSPWTTPYALWLSKTLYQAKSSPSLLNKLKKQKAVAPFLKKAPPGKRDNSAMSRGRRLEPLIARQYCDLMGYEITTPCIVHEEHDWIRSSLDGYNAARNIICEIKAPGAEDHEAALAGAPPMKYQPQCDHNLLASGARLLHYVSYSDWFPPHQQLAICTVYPDPARLNQLFQAEKEFWDLVLSGVPPYCPE